jgi:integrase/recombinase XerD
MPSVTPVLWKPKQNEHGTPIYIRVSDANSTRYISLGVRVQPSEWNERTKRVKRHPDAEHINSLIARRVADLESQIVRLTSAGVTATAADLKKGLIRGSKRIDFFSFAEQAVQQLEERGQIYTAKRYRSICKKFRNFAGAPLQFDKMTVALLREFETHLLRHYENSHNTVATNFNAIRAILRQAIAQGVADQSKNPFTSFKPGRKTLPERHKLTEEELARIETLELEKESLIWHVRNYFMLAFYLGGIRFGDLAKLRRQQLNGGILTFRMSKTGKPKSVRLVPQAIAILGHYHKEPSNPKGNGFLVPILDEYDVSTPKALVRAVSAQNALINKYLKTIAKMAKIGAPLSTHIARHSFADLARRRGIDIYTVSALLGHSSVTVTQAYVNSLGGEELSRAMDSIF